MPTAENGTLYVPEPSADVSYTWQHNGVDIPNGSGSSHTLTDIQPYQTGLYTYTASLPNAGASVTSSAMIVGLETSEKVVGDGSEVGADIPHPNGNIYDQVLLAGPGATVTANPGQVTRVSFVDLSNDIVQVELSGAGTLS